MKLYYAPGACSLSNRIAINELGLDATYDKTDIRAKKTESGRDFTEINPLGYVPALELDNGEILTENPAILGWLAAQKPGTIDPGNDPLERARLDETLAFLSSELHKTFGPFFGGLEGEARDTAMKKLESRVGHVERLLGDGRDYLLGDRFTVADALAFVILSWAPKFDVSLAKWPKVDAFVQRVGKRPAVRKSLEEEGLLETAEA